MQYVEVVRFQLKEGVSEAQILAAEDAVRAGAIQKQPGYQGRELYRDGAAWLIIIRWDSKEHGDAWSPVFMASNEGKTFGSLMNFASARQEHYTLTSKT